MKQWWLGIFSAWLFAAVLWGVYLATDPGRVPVGAVKVEGEFRYLSRDRLEQVIAAQVQEGFFRVDLEDVRRAVLGLPWVKDSTVRRVWPDGLHIRVQERQAAARWARGGLLDADGMRFDAPARSGPAGLPVLQGPEESEALLVRRLRTLREWLGPLQDPIQGVVMDARYAWRVRLAGGTVLVLGRQPSERDVRRFARVFPAVLAIRGGKAERVDLRYPNGFAVDWTEGPGPQADES